MTVPHTFTQPGPRPEGDRPCRTCSLALDAHTGRIRTATARRDAGVPLDDIDRSALATAGSVAA